MLIRIIGIGSPFGDDAAGLEVARMLAQKPPPNCEVLVADRPGTGLLDLMDGASAVFLVDAVRSGARPGTLHRLSFDELARCTAHFVSSHELGVAASVQLARKLGCAPAQVSVLGIEISPAPDRIRCSLSRTAQRAVDRALPQLRLWVNELNTSNEQLAREVSQWDNRNLPLQSKL
jgi:hydrogenase maturation protease